MRVTGRFTTVASLPANLTTLTNIGPDGQNLMQNWSFSDGRLTYTASNSKLLPTLPASSGIPGEASGSSVTTDAQGNITSSMVWPWAPIPPHTVGQRVDSLMVFFNVSDGSTTQSGEGITAQGTCAAVEPSLGNICSNAIQPFDTFFINPNPGKWSTFAPTPDTGQTIAGTASAAIPNVAANDSVNGAPATVGAGGNATVAAQGNWPSGISLDTTTGAVLVAASAPAGSYSMTYQLCDSQSPLACVEVAANVDVKPSTPPGPSGATPVPTLGEWSLIGLTTLVAMVGFGRIRRRQS